MTTWPCARRVDRAPSYARKKCPDRELLWISHTHRASEQKSAFCAPPIALPKEPTDKGPTARSRSPCHRCRWQKLASWEPFQAYPNIRAAGWRGNRPLRRSSILAPKPALSHRLAWPATAAGILSSPAPQNFPSDEKNSQRVSTSPAPLTPQTTPGEHTPA